jgi:hypothetical protein
MFRLWLVRVFGKAFEAPLDSVVDWIGENRGILLVVTVGLVLVSIALEARSGETEVASLARLDDELEAEADAEAEAGHRRTTAGRDDRADDRADERETGRSGPAAPDDG